MPFYILSFIVSLIPVIILYLWFKNKVKEDLTYKEMCKKMMIAGLLSVLPVTLFSMILNIILNIFFVDRTSLLRIFIYNFFVLAFSEEVVKMATFYHIRKKNNYICSPLETMIFAGIVAIGFEILESFVYMIGSNPIEMIVRGVTMMHAGFGLFMGYYLAKGEETKDKKYYVIAFIIPWILHGLYDFSLQSEFLELNEYYVFVPFIIIIFLFVVIFKSIRLIKKHHQDEQI